jgi:nucleoside-diphosphate-sugar epimerase
MGTDERFLVTGALGCIGAWTMTLLAREGLTPVGFDLDGEPVRIRQIATSQELDRMRLRRGDITDGGAVERAVREEGITHVVHLAGLTSPYCQADPPLGARVNVLGTINVFEAVHAVEGQVAGLSYASSSAVFGSPGQYEGGRVSDASPPAPETLYGVYKQANEWTARVYQRTRGVGSVGLRPFIVYGVGRDRGLSAGITQAMLAAAAGTPFHISFGGSSVFQLAEDVAGLFIRCARATPDHAAVLNVGGPPTSVAELVSVLEGVVPSAAGAITYERTQLPYPALVDDDGIRHLLPGVTATPLADGVRRTVDHYRRMLDRGGIEPPMAEKG